MDLEGISKRGITVVVETSVYDFASFKFTAKSLEDAVTGAEYVKREASRLKRAEIDRYNATHKGVERPEGE